MSLFGNSGTQNAGGGGLFGSSTNQASNTGGLFGSNTSQNNNAGGGLFGSSTNQANKPAGGLFGSNTAQPNTATSTGGLFGSNTAQQGGPAAGGGSLFGANTAPNQTGTGGGLFGSSTNQNTNAGGGLFGSGTAQNTGGTGTGLFGANTTQNQNNAGSSLFGNNQNTSSSNNTQQNAIGTGLTGSLWGTSNNQTQSSSNLGAQVQQPQQAGQMNNSLFGPQTVSVAGGHSMTPAQFQQMQMKGFSTTPNERTIAQQLMTVSLKWMPQPPENTGVSTPLKTYFYNAVSKDYAPFHYPDPSRGEDEQSWEEALSQKPEVPNVDGKEIANIAFVPTLCRGFKELGDRVETQAKTFEVMRNRLHEMNNSLSAVMEAHQQRITVKIGQARKQHEVLSQRCLRLAVKVQVLRNRGYALDAAEENLRKTLLTLEKQVMDPSFLGREDEIWARMVTLRERTRWLEEESKRVSAELDEQKQQGSESGAGVVPEHVLAKTKKILKDYEGQLQHLHRELQDIKREYAEWEDAQIRRR